ncbi:non-ribosomal peptide synthetase [Pelomyxa schiedti]|nr:non-ribosomal peptide synthetase [Pelomyxa schiedti]
MSAVVPPTTPRLRRIALCSGFNDDPDTAKWLLDKLAEWSAASPGIVGPWIRRTLEVLTRTVNKPITMKRLCDAVGADADAFFRPNGDGSFARKYDPHSWVHDRESRPSNKLLAIPLICIPLQTIYSCACFLAAALERGSDEDDPDGNKRFLAFARSFDVCVGYSAGQIPVSAILKADSVAQFQAMCLSGCKRGFHMMLSTLEIHIKQWGKEVMSEYWMCMFKVPVATLEKHIAAVNSEFPSTPLFLSIRLTPTQSVVSGHPTPLAQLQSLFPPRQVKVLQVTEGFHAPFYLIEIMNQFLRRVPPTKYSLWNPVPNSAAFFSTSLNADISQLEALRYCETVHTDGMGLPIDWPETVKAIVSHNGGCDSVEIFDFGPPGVGFLTHALCASVLKKKSTLINCVTAHDTPKVPPSPSSSKEPSRPKIDTETLTPMERKVLEIWCEVLPAQPSSIDEDFFEAGGDSIGMLKAIASADKRGLSLNLSDLFSARTIRSMAALLAESNSATKFKFPPIKPLPASPSNKRKLQPNSVQYSVFGGAHLFGHLDSSALWKATHAMAVHHEILRTRFAAEESSGSGQGVQVILPPEDATTVIGIREVNFCPPATGSSPEDWLAKEYRKEVSTPFDLKTGPLMRLTLFRLGAEEAVLFFNAHHIITDGWSMVVFVRELSYRYNQEILNNRPASSTATPTPIDPTKSSFSNPLPFQYADFAVWQRELLGTSSELKEKQLSFWKKELEGVNSVCELPLDRPRTDNRTYSAGFHIHMIPPSLFSALTTLGKSISTATPFMTVLTVFNILLHLHSPRWAKPDKETTPGTPSNPQGDIVVGIPTANRHYPGVESLIGFFVNTLPIRTIVEDAGSFKETLESVKRKVLSVQEAQDIPLDWIVDTAGIETRMSMHTLVQVSFVMDDWKFVNNKNFTMEGIRDVKLLYNIHPVMSKFDLTLNAVPQSDGSLELQFEFAKDILDDSTVVRFANNMETLMKSVVSCPDKPISQLNCIHESETKSLTKKREKQSTSCSRSPSQSMEISQP